MDIYKEVAKALTTDAKTYKGTRGKGFTIKYDFEYTDSGNKGVGGIEISIKPGQNLDEVLKNYNTMKKALTDKVHKKEIKNPKIRKADEAKFLAFIKEQ